MSAEPGEHMHRASWLGPIKMLCPIIGWRSYFSSTYIVID